MEGDYINEELTEGGFEVVEGGVFSSSSVD